MSDDQPKNRAERRQRLIELAVQGKPYTEIAAELYPNSRYPRQVVYNALQSPRVRREVEQIISERRKKVERVIDSVLDNVTPAKLTSSQAKIIELAARLEKMLVDVQEQHVIDEPPEIDLSKVSTDELYRVLIDRLKQ